MLNKFRFLRAIRIFDAKSYRGVMQQKTRIYLRHFIVYYCLNDNENPRMGVIVSKRVSKRAVTRNRIKRQVREWFRLNQHRVSGLSVVIIAKESAERAPNVELQICLDQLSKKLVTELASLSLA